MKLLAATIALIVAAPAAAQTDTHAGHKPAEHEQHKSGEPEGMDCCKDKDGNGRMDCCDEAKDGSAMECCKKHSKEKAGQDKHEGH